MSYIAVFKGLYEESEFCNAWESKFRPDGMIMALLRANDECRFRTV